ncbi:hypothetical protein EG352_07205 [Chryseobacterium indologenes]|uniref:Uncharacterized protein n=1 Tax=Chryseobacterium indologenes TaxID=253 RepID=A0AAD0YVQ2_CHRID|nr:hypothetical protein [Chryseobacterium indologenes]AZB17566.1 hypothetical protein EG352_07205 [Chryseobacterium indologenes]
MKISKLNLRQLFAKGLKPAQEAFYNWQDSYWHKDELIDISSVKNLQTSLDQKLDLSVQDTLLTAFDKAVDELTDLAQSAYKGIAEAATVPPTTGVFWYKVEDNNVAIFTKFIDSTGNPIQTTALDFKDAGGNYYDVTLEIQNNISKKVHRLRPSSVFSEQEFNNIALNVGESKISLVSKDLSNVNFINSIANGAGSSIFTTKLDANQNIGKLRIKVETAGIGNFTARRGTSIIAIKSNVPLIPGWNDVDVNFNGMTNDYIGYNTKDSTSKLYFIDGNGGNYYSLNSGNIVVNNGNIAIEVYNKVYNGNTFKDVLGLKEISSNTFNQLNKISAPKIRSKDYGVVSIFNLPEMKDQMKNNLLSLDGSAILGNFESRSMYTFSFGFAVDFPAMYNTTINIVTIDFGSFKMTVGAGGSGIGVTVDSEINGLPFDYSNKRVHFVLKGNAYFVACYVNGTQIGFLNKGKIVSKLQFKFPQTNGQVIKNITYWSREISNSRMIKWGDSTNIGTYLNAFDQTTGEDRLFPSEGLVLLPNALVSNPYFDFDAEQCIVKFKGVYHLYFSAHKATPSTVLDSGIALALSNRIDGGYMMYGNDAVIGGNRAKAGVNRAMGCWAGVYNDAVYVFSAVDYNVTNSGSNIHKSLDGKNFSKVGSFITDLPTVANIGIWPEKQPDGFFYGLVEGRPGSIWELHLVKSQNFENGWTTVQKLPTLQVKDGGMYGGARLMRSINNDRWMVFYHASHDLTGNLPTACYYAESFDAVPINWVNKQKLVEVTDVIKNHGANSLSALTSDQTATPHVIEADGKTYISYCLAQNIPGLLTQLRIVEFDGTKEELVGITPING